MEDCNQNGNVTELGRKILELRSQGLSFRDIALKIPCAKSTVSYWCSSTTKTKIKEYRDSKYIGHTLHKHLTNFKSRDQNFTQVDFGICTWDHKFRTMSSNFRNRNNMEVELKYSYKDVIEHVGGIETKCYLTGRPINLTENKYNLDHIIPVSKGGSNELVNMGLTCPEANASKSNMTVEEYLELCKEVLSNFGYTITKQEQ